MGFSVVWTRESENFEWRSRQMESGTAVDDEGKIDISACELSGAEKAFRQGDSRVCRRSIGTEQEQKTSDRCAIAGRIQRRDYTRARVSTGRRVARRPHSRREKRALENSHERRQHVPIGRAPAENLRRQCRREPV